MNSGVISTASSAVCLVGQKTHPTAADLAVEITMALAAVDFSLI